MSGPHWTKNWIETLWRFTSENFVNFDTNEVDYEALGREEFEFRKALFYRNFKNSKRALEAFKEADEMHRSFSERGKRGGLAKAAKTNESTAGAPTREDGEDRKSTTPATIYGDADTREGSDASTTVSTNIGNDQETEARQRKAGCNTRHTPPEVSRESGNNFESAIAEALEKARTGGDSVRRVGVASPAVCHKSAGAPVRLPSWPEFLQYVNANNIDYTDAREWFEMSIVDRDGKDREGNAIKNWKAALKAFCRSKEASRRKTA